VPAAVASRRLGAGDASVYQGQGSALEPGSREATARAARTPTPQNLFPALGARNATAPNLPQAIMPAMRTSIMAERDPLWHTFIPH